MKKTGAQPANRGPIEEGKLFGRPCPYDLMEFRPIFDSEKLIPRKNIAVIDPDEILKKTLGTLKRICKSNLLYFGVTGSYITGQTNQYSDLDTIAIFKNPVELPIFPEEVHPEMHILSRLREFIECGDLVRICIFRKSNSLHTTPEAEELRNLEPLKEKALPYLRKKIMFNLYTSKQLFGNANKYKATLLDYLGKTEQAFKQLSGKDTEDNQMTDLLQTNVSKQAQTYKNMLDVFSDRAMDWLLVASTNTAGLMALGQKNEVLDLSEHIEFAGNIDKNWGNLLKEMLNKKKETRYRIKVITISELKNLIELGEEYIKKYII